MTHIISTNLVSFKRKALVAPDGYRFDMKLGAWVSDKSVDQILVRGKGKPAQGTKKNDIETGEDLKSS